MFGADTQSSPIVCGIDGSDNSLAAAAVAAGLAQRLGARLLLTHVVESLSGGRPQTSRRPAHAEAELLFERIKPRFPTVEIEGLAIDGVPVYTLAELAAEANAALLVVGSRGRAPVKSALLGSVSSAVARQSDRPVVMVPPEGQAPEWQTDGRSVIVCGVDGSEEAKRAARGAVRLADS